MTNLGIEALTVYCPSPVAFIHLAADLGCGHISTGLNSANFGQPNAVDWSLRDDLPLRRATVAAMAERGVAISLGEGFAIRPGLEVADRRADLELFRELGVTRINTVVMEADRSRALDQIGTLATLANGLGIETTLELPPTSVIGSLDAGVAALNELRLPNLRLLIDTMHFVRSGSRVADLAALAPDLIGYVQLADAAMGGCDDTYMTEAMTGRLPPGEGELPLVAVLKALPKDKVISIEVPSNAWFATGNARDWAAHCVAAARRVLAQVPA